MQERRALAEETSQDAQTLSPILPQEVEASAAAMLKAACDAELTLVTAESCTGGLLASLLTDVEGCSHAFERGFVVYSVDAKCEMLGLKQQDVEACGAVSKEVALAMAQGALDHSRASIALAVTGFAGSGDEPGLVHFGCARRNGGVWHREEHFGDIGRGPVRIASLRVALEMLHHAMT